MGQVLPASWAGRQCMDQQNGCKTCAWEQEGGGGEGPGLGGPGVLPGLYASLVYTSCTPLLLPPPGYTTATWHGYGRAVQRRAPRRAASLGSESQKSLGQKPAGPQNCQNCQ